MFLFRILRALYGIWSMILFIILMVIMAPIVILIFVSMPEKKAPHVAHAAVRIWGKLLQFLLIIPITVKNREYIDPKRTYVFVANHRSQLDIPVYAESCTNTLRFLAKAELTKIPLLGYVIRKMYITVNREERRDRNKSIEIMRRTLEEGISVFLAPEGTRNRKKDPPLLDFRDGAFRLAIATQTPVAVLTVLNADEKLSPNRPIELAPGRIYGVWDKPIETKGMTLDDIPALKEKVRQLMLTRLGEKVS